MTIGAQFRVVFVNRMMGIHRGGGENVDLHLAEGLRSRACDVQFVAGRSWCALRFPLNRFRTSYIRTPYLRGLMYSWADSPSIVFRKMGSLMARVDEELFERAVLYHVRTHRDLQGVDVFQLCALPRLGAWLGRETGALSVIRWPGPPSPRALSWAKRCSVTVANGYAFEEARKELKHHVREVAVGVDTEMFRPERRGDFWKTRGVPRNGIVVLFVGRFIPMKNLPMLLKGFAHALKHSPDLYLALVGDGSEMANVVGMINDLQIESNTVLTGVLVEEALAAAYASADIFAITSQPGYGESFPNVVLEAMASGLPVLGTRVASIPSQIRDGVNGLLVDDGDWYGLGVAIRKVAGSDEMRLQMGLESRKQVSDEYRWDASVDQLLALYQEVRRTRVGRPSHW